MYLYVLKGDKNDKQDKAGKNPNHLYKLLEMWKYNVST
jgi:hypothetical protein